MQTSWNTEYQSVHSISVLSKCTSTNKKNVTPRTVSAESRSSCQLLVPDCGSEKDAKNAVISISCIVKKPGRHTHTINEAYMRTDFFCNFANFLICRYDLICNVQHECILGGAVS